MGKLRLGLDELAVDDLRDRADATDPRRDGGCARGDGQAAVRIPTLKTDLTCCPCTPMI